MALRTIGDHKRKRRLDLGLLQREVALLLGVDQTTVYNWEAGRRTTPNLRALLRVLRFIGYDPNETGSALGKWLSLARRVQACSHGGRVRKLSAHPSVILVRERGRHRLVLV